MNNQQAGDFDWARNEKKIYGDFIQSIFSHTVKIGEVGDKGEGKRSRERSEKDEKC